MGGDYEGGEDLRKVHQFGLPWGPETTPHPHRVGKEGEPGVGSPINVGGGRERYE